MKNYLYLFSIIMEDNYSLMGEHGKATGKPVYIGNCNIDGLGYLHVSVEILPLEDSTFRYNLIVSKPEGDRKRTYKKEYCLYPDKYIDSKGLPKANEIRDLSEKIKTGATEEARKLIENDSYWTGPWSKLPYTEDSETAAC